MYSRVGHFQPRRLNRYSLTLKGGEKRLVFVPPPVLRVRKIVNVSKRGQLERVVYRDNFGLPLFLGAADEFTLSSVEAGASGDADDDVIGPTPDDF